MGIFSKLSGTDARYDEYRKTADLALQELVSHSYKIGKSFEEIMSLKSASPEIRVCAYLAGYISMTFENTGYHHVKAYKRYTISRAAKDAVDETGYKGIDMDFVYSQMIPGLLKEGRKDTVEYVAQQTTFSIPGGVVAQNMMSGDKEGALHHLTICLNTMMMESPKYDVHGHSNHKDYQF